MPITHSTTDNLRDRLNDIDNGDTAYEVQWFISDALAFLYDVHPEPMKALTYALSIAGQGRTIVPTEEG